MSRVVTSTPAPKKPLSMKEFETEIERLRKANFSLKLRVYQLQEKLEQSASVRPEDVDEEGRQYLAMQASVRTLKKELEEKRIVISQSEHAITQLQAEVASWKSRVSDDEAAKRKILQQKEEMEEMSRRLADSETRYNERYEELLQSRNRIQTLSYQLERLQGLTKEDKAAPSLQTELASVRMKLSRAEESLRQCERQTGARDAESSALREALREKDFLLETAKKKLQKREGRLSESAKLQDASNGRSAAEAESLRANAAAEQLAAMRVLEARIAELEQAMREKDDEILRLRAASEELSTTARLLTDERSALRQRCEIVFAVGRARCSAFQQDGRLSKSVALFESRS